MLKFIFRLLRTTNHAISIAYNWAAFHSKDVNCHTSLKNINGMLRIAGEGRIQIGAGTRMNSGPLFNPIGGDTRLFLVCRNGGEILIGSNCGLSNCAIVANTRVTIEDGVIIGGGTKIYDTDFHSTDPILRRGEKAGQFHGISKPVTIRRNAFIGAHAIILKGIIIGENSVIGAGSVVTRDVPSNEVWAGNPAVRVRHLELTGIALYPTD